MTAAAESSKGALAAHTAVTLALAQRECAEHLEGMKEVRESMRQRPLQIVAKALDDPDAPTISTDVKVVHFVRHGQGFHNLMADTFQAQGKTWTQYVVSDDNPYCMPELLDSPLTEKGRQQALLLQPRVAAMTSKPGLVVLSPNCRALQTGLLVFEELKGPFLAHEMVREECGVHICDKRRSKKRQKAEFPRVNFVLLAEDEDPLFDPEHRETKQQVADRIYKFMEWLADRPEPHVAISSHSAWLLTFFNGVCECQPELLVWFQTGEMRSVVLEFRRQSK